MEYSDLRSERPFIIIIFYANVGANPGHMTPGILAAIMTYWEER